MGGEWHEESGRHTLILGLEGLNSVSHEFLLLPTLLNKRVEEADFVFEPRGVRGGEVERGVGDND